ncbi:hypothetical protein NKH18_20810 [Streptomyces sp. M10(2022)]
MTRLFDSALGRLDPRLSEAFLQAGSASPGTFRAEDTPPCPKRYWNSWPTPDSWRTARRARTASTNCSAPTHEEPPATASAAQRRCDPMAESAASAEEAVTGTTFDSLAGTRPRIRRDVLFTETPGGCSSTTPTAGST